MKSSCFSICDLVVVSRTRGKAQDSMPFPIMKFSSARLLMHPIVYSYFMLQQVIVQNIFSEVQIPTWQAIARGKAEGNSVSSRYLHRRENVLHYCLFKLEITVLLPNYIVVI